MDRQNWTLYGEIRFTHVYTPIVGNKIAIYSQNTLKGTWK
jgi:hypothetical protein